MSVPKLRLMLATVSPGPTIYNSIILHRELMFKLGTREAIMLCLIDAITKSGANSVIHEEGVWFAASRAFWMETLPDWSARTIERVLKKLSDQGYIEKISLPYGEPPRLTNHYRHALSNIEALGDFRIIEKPITEPETLHRQNAHVQQSSLTLPRQDAHVQQSSSHNDAANDPGGQNDQGDSFVIYNNKDYITHQSVESLAFKDSQESSSLTLDDSSIEPVYESLFKTTPRHFIRAGSGNGKIHFPLEEEDQAACRPLKQPRIIPLEGAAREDAECFCLNCRFEVNVGNEIVESLLDIYCTDAPDAEGHRESKRAQARRQAQIIYDRGPKYCRLDHMKLFKRWRKQRKMDRGGGKNINYAAKQFSDYVNAVMRG